MTQEKTEVKPEVKEDKPKEQFGTEVEVGGQKFVVTDQMAKALEAQSQSTKKLLEDFKTSLKTDIDSLKPKKKDEEDELDIFSDPKGYLEKFGKSLRDQIVGDLTTKYTADQSEKEFWSSFYRENEDLKDDDFIVRAVMARDWSEIGKLKAKDASKELADRTRKAILRYGEKKEKPKPPRVEGVSYPGIEMKEEKPEKIVTLSDIIKRRREARRKKSA